MDGVSIKKKENSYRADEPINRDAVTQSARICEIAGAPMR